MARNDRDTYIKKMIETNIAILNGKKIADAEKEFYDQTREISLFPCFEIDKAVKEEYEEQLKSYKDDWLKHWDNINKKDECG